MDEVNQHRKYSANHLGWLAHRGYLAEQLEYDFLSAEILAEDAFEPLSNVTM